MSCQHDCKAWKGKREGVYLFKGRMASAEHEEELDEELEGYDEKDAELKAEEDEFLQNALEGFLNARQSENYPMCGMDEATVEFLIAMLAMEYEQFEVASKILPSIITSVTANNRMKDKAREAKDILLEKMKEKEKNANG